MIPSEMRAKAAEMRAAARKINLAITPDALGVIDFRPVVTAIVGYAEAGTLEAMADAFEYQARSMGPRSLQARRQALMEKNDAIRDAVAAGDWAKFDELNGISRSPSDTGSGGSEGGTSPAP
jgi:hypothetical protein